MYHYIREPKSLLSYLHSVPMCVCVAIARQFLAFRVSDSRTPQKWTPTALAVPHSKIDTRDNISIDH
mgnify:CR=1 FL=1